MPGNIQVCPFEFQVALQSNLDLNYLTLTMAEITNFKGRRESLF
jgi:hypothetical protein